MNYGFIFSAYEPEELNGCTNEAADAVPREDETWSDTNLMRKTFSDASFARLTCRRCKGRLFEVLQTGSYETTARCPCGMYYIVHTG